MTFNLKLLYEETENRSLMTANCSIDVTSLVPEHNEIKKFDNIN